MTEKCTAVVQSIPAFALDDSRLSLEFTKGEHSQNVLGCTATTLAGGDLGIVYESGT